MEDNSPRRRHGLTGRHDGTRRAAARDGGRRANHARHVRRRGSSLVESARARNGAASHHPMTSAWGIRCWMSSSALGGGQLHGLNEFQQLLRRRAASGDPAAWLIGLFASAAPQSVGAAGAAPNCPQTQHMCGLANSLPRDGGGGEGRSRGALKTSACRTGWGAEACTHSPSATSRQSSILGFSRWWGLLREPRWAAMSMECAQGRSGP